MRFRVVASISIRRERLWAPGRIRLASRLASCIKMASLQNIPGPSGAKSSVAYGINDSGQIVGYYTDSGGKIHGFLRKGTTYTILNVPGAASTIATGINKAGIIVMYYGMGTHIWSARYNGKTYTTINVPHAANSLARDISNTGDIVYEILDSSFEHEEGVLFHAGTYYTVDYPGSAATSGFGVNDKKGVVSFGKNSATPPPRVSIPLFWQRGVRWACAKSAYNVPISDLTNLLVAVDVLLRQEPDQDEDEDEEKEDEDEERKK